MLPFADSEELAMTPSWVDKPAGLTRWLGLALCCEVYLGPQPYAGHAVAARRCTKPAVGPTGTVGRAGRGSNASTHAHLGTAGRGTRKGTAGCERAGGAA
jgi:hypothetical protein